MMKCLGRGGAEERLSARFIGRRHFARCAQLAITHAECQSAKERARLTTLAISSRSAGSLSAQHATRLTTHLHAYHRFT